MIVVTGANGPFGRVVAQHLLARVPAGDLAVSVRDTAAAGHLADQGVDVRHGDFDAPGTLPAAFAGADTVLINGTNYGTASPARAAQQAAAIRAAQAAGATRIVVTSWHDLENCRLEMAGDFPATEKLVTGSTGDWTILRMIYGMAASLARDVRSATAAGELSAPAGDARATPAATADLAEATANVLVEPGHHAKTYELTGPEAITWHDLASLATTMTGRRIGYRSISDDEFRAQVLAAGFPPRGVDSLIAYYGAFRAGWANTPTADLAHLLRRPATGSRDAVEQAALAPR
ncbi:MAG TPA: NAD(P)H-binding protein [Actinoplanes sp.]|nr:NAD(P)H-binding protein [Actinoplanes sp.]